MQLTPLAPTLPIRAVVFDLDGTLIDSAPGLRLAACAMLAEQNLPQPDLPTVIGFIGNGVPKLVERSLLWAGVAPAAHPDAVARFMEHYDRYAMTGTTAYPGAKDGLRALAARGLKLGLCTNKPVAPTRAILRAMSLGPFDAVLGGDSLPVRKPDPAPLLRVIADLGATPDQAIYVGDSVTDWKTAQAARVAYVHVKGGYQLTPIDDFAPWAEIASLKQIEELS
ncbi:phosphoglycolate phosphatase [Jannaschia faecimaris]|uniref:Phosphoglycolate phosphatase n=1 Tax=Jannaschia faecimaris TaxID=1244108 RepID=A0A1H3QV86_9RHOB|nr:phosphoglycolate phosphatase [Jannaschia faecimaris]SDZ16908.1 phosphoglycolate phosphatase [Jannaschia faecimaris]